MGNVTARGTAPRDRGVAGTQPLGHHAVVGGVKDDLVKAATGSIEQAQVRQDAHRLARGVTQINTAKGAAASGEVLGIPGEGGSIKRERRIGGPEIGIAARVGLVEDLVAGKLAAGR
ncbi:hypothetical protein GALL_453220 [mine drainage metagenome]|uniref:Uncharacterized protein n=1 Tax=mine drainage metagenome TaxID=410659 RepID=A0A1J5PNA0_9ZZZZ